MVARSARSRRAFSIAGGGVSRGVCARTSAAGRSPAHKHKRSVVLITYPRALDTERGDHGTMIARAEFPLDRRRRAAVVESPAGQHVIQPPADITLLHVPPRGPP